MKAGDVAPSFTLPAQEGHLVHSQELLAKGPLVLVFYRGVWCPYCNIALAAYQTDLVDALNARGVAAPGAAAANGRK